MHFISFEKEDQLSGIINNSGYSVIFKHNTTCPISKAVRSDFEVEAPVLLEGVPVYFLDLLAFRNISDAVAESFNVKHESPQLLLIKDGKCTYNDSHYDISAGRAAAAMLND